jgi:RHS repeat-associated protein
MCLALAPCTYAPQNRPSPGSPMAAVPIEMAPSLHALLWNVAVGIRAALTANVRASRCARSIIPLGQESQRRTLCLILAIALAGPVGSQAFAQLAPSGEHYAGRPSDTGYGGTDVDASGNLPSSIALDLPPVRGGLPIPLQIVYGPHRVGAAGLGWDIPLSYLQQNATFAHRRPASAAGAAPTPRQRTTLSLLGQTADLIQQGDEWVARVGTLELIVRQEGSLWHAYDGQGRTYTFERPTGLPNARIWLLKSISAAGGTTVSLVYDVSSVPINGGVGTSINLVDIEYNTYPNLSLSGISCGRNEISLSYVIPEVNSVYAPVNSLPTPFSMSVLDDMILVRRTRLDQIDIKSRASCQVVHQRLRRYSFQYSPDADTGLPQLVKVSEFGREGTPEATTPLPVAAYEYGSATSNGVLRYSRNQTVAMPPGMLEDEVSATAQDSSVNAPESGEGYAMWQTLEDFDGDGRPDLVFKKGNKLWVAKGRASASGSTTFGVGPQALTELSDGTFASGGISTQSMTTRRFLSDTAIRNTNDVWRQAIDVNGDGRIDIVDAAEEAGHWVVYLNTPGGASGVKWERRSFSVEALQKYLQTLGHNINGNHLPLSRQSTGTSLEKYTCFRWDGKQWQWYSDGFGHPEACQGSENKVVARAAEQTYTEWELTDLNGDGYPDFVFDSRSVDFQVPYPSNVPTPAVGAKQGGLRWFFFKPGIALPNTVCGKDLSKCNNQVRAEFNVLGVRFDTDADPFAASINLNVLGPELGISDWTCPSGVAENPNASCNQTYQHQSVGLADVNGDGMLDRVVGNFAYLGTYSGKGLSPAFSSAYIILPGPLATQVSTHDTECKTNPKQISTATQTQGLRDLTGDGIPDYYDASTPVTYPPGPGIPKLWIGTGVGFHLSIPIDSSGANFQFSHETESCDGKTSKTDGGLYDIDGDGKPEVIGLVGNTFYISQLVGGRVPGTPESGRLTGVDNGYGAKTTINYVSAKQFDDNPLPFPELVVSSVATQGVHNLGGTIDGFSYAYSKGELTFNSALDRFGFPGYQRQVAVQLLNTPAYTPPPFGNKTSGGAIGGGPIPGEKLSGTATVTDTWRLAPFSNALTQQQRWLREQVVGQVRDVLTLRSISNPDPWSLLGVEANDSRVIGETNYNWDVKFYETPLTPPANAIDCFDIVDPLDFQQTLASLTANSVDVCRAHGFPFQTTTTTWHGDAAPPSDKNVQTQTQATSVDDFGRPVITEYDNDVFRSDDDYCVANSFATPAKEYPRVLTALSSRRIYVCGEVYGNPLASESWIYDNLPAGTVSDGRVTSHTVDRRSSDTGVLLNTYQDYAATYNAAGNISSVSTQRDNTTRTVTFEYDPFGLVATHVNRNATGVPPTSVAIAYDPISSLPLTSIDPNNLRRGTDYDGFGRPVRSTLTLRGGSTGVWATAAYAGFDGSDPHGRRVSVTQYRDPVSPANLATSSGRSTTRSFDELGRRYRTDVSLGSDYSNQSLTVEWSTYDGAGRLVFSPDPFAADQAPTSAYGRSYFYKDTGDLDCIVLGRGLAHAVENVTDLAVERFPTCFQRSFDDHVDTLDVRDASSLQPNSPQAGVVNRVARTAIGWTTERSTLQAGVRIEDARFTFDRLGQQTTTSRFLDPANANEAVVWSTHLDSLGQILQLTEPATATRSYTYSVWGEPLKTEWTDGSINHALISTYDSLSRLLTNHEENNGVADPDTVNSYSYDAPVNLSPRVSPTFVLGQLASATSPRGAVAFSYDALGSLNARTFSDGAGGIYVDRPAYHTDGTLDSLTFNLPDNGYAPELVKYGYDSAGRSRSIHYSDGTGEQSLYSAGNIDLFGRVTSAKYGGTTTFSAEYAEDGRRLIKAIAIGSPSGSRRIVYGQFDPMTRELSRQEISNDAASGRSATLSYDSLGRLASSIQTEPPSKPTHWTFSYDALGNTRQLTNATENTGTTLSYDKRDKDRVCHIGYADNGFTLWLSGLEAYLPPPCNVTYDAIGGVLKEPARNGTREFSYLLSGNVRSITQRDKKASLTYDAFGQLQTLDVQSNSHASRHEAHFGDLIERHDLAQNGSASFITRNIPGPNGILASRRGPTNDWVYGFGELRGNRFSTNQGGAFVQDIDYQPFGESKSTGAAPGTPDYTSYQWNGGDALSEFGLSHLGARVYDPVIGRFLSRDPLLISRTGSSSNPYAFAADDPWNAADPSGLDVLPCDEECQNNNIGFQPFPGSDGFGQGSSGGIISADWLELHYHAPPPALSVGSRSQAGIALENAVSGELGYPAPKNFNWDKLAEYGFTRDEALERIKNSISLERDAQIDARNAKIDRAEHYVRVGGLVVAGAALAVAGGAALLPGLTSASVTPIVVGGGGAATVLEPELENGLEAGAADSAATETFFRTMSETHYDQLQTTGEIPATGETFISPSLEYASRYNGVTVQFNVQAGTTDSLLGIGVRNAGLSGGVYDRLPLVQSGWGSTSAFFKLEGIVVNIGLGNGTALSTFNNSIVDFDVIPKP